MKTLTSLLTATLSLMVTCFLIGCGTGGGDSSESNYTTATSSDDDTATCYYTVDSQGNYVEVGEVNPPAETEDVITEDTQPDEAEVIEVDWADDTSVASLRALPRGTFFVASCTGDVNVSFDTTTTTTTGGGE